MRSWQKAEELDGWRAPDLTVGVVLQARARLKTCKCNGGRENIVAEMIRLLPVSAVYVVANLFEKRYSGEVVEDITTWRSIIIVFLAKVVHPTKMQQFRGIALLSVMSK